MKKLATLMVLMAFADVAAAAVDKKYTDGYDMAFGPDVGFPIYTVLCMLVFVAAVAAVAFKNSKRTHLD